MPPAAALAVQPADYLAWREKRLAELEAPDSWLGLVGLFWLEPGRNAVGSAPGSAVLLPSGPPHLGDLQLAADGLAWFPAAGAGSGEPLRTDAAGEPTTIVCGSLSFFVMEREGRLAVRLRDREWAGRRPFAGLECHPYSTDWRIEADWQGLDDPLDLEVPSVTGVLQRVRVTHRAAFVRAGVEYALLPLSSGEEGVFFVFRDAASGHENYGGGRFLRAGPPSGGRLVLDFNRASNPPCAFTPFATCPLPPPENWLPFAVTAGERKYAGAY